MTGKKNEILKTDWQTKKREYKKKDYEKKVIKIELK